MNGFYKSLVNPKGRFGIWGIVALFLLGVALMAAPAFFGQDKPAPVPAGGQSQEISESRGSLQGVEEQINRQVAGILGQVAGVGTVSVSVSLESGPETDYAENLTDDRSTVEEKDTGGGTRLTTEANQKAELVFAANHSAPVVVKEIGPKIKGIVVVADGAHDSATKAKLSQAVQALLGLPAHRVMILPKESR